MNVREREFKLLDKAKDNMYGIYQLNYEAELRYHRFVSYKELLKQGFSVDRTNYNFIYADVLENENLEDIYERFNLYKPDDFRGHSLSVSDIVVMKKDGAIKAYYCDSYGFQEVPEFAAGLYNLEPLITVTGTENCSLRKGQTMSLNEANNLIAELDYGQIGNRHKPECHGKNCSSANYIIHYLQNYEYYTHCGQINFGSGDGSLIAHIRAQADMKKIEKLQLAYKEEIKPKDFLPLDFILNDFVPYLILHDEFAEFNKIIDEMPDNAEVTNILDRKEACRKVKKHIDDCRTVLNTKENIAFPEFPELPSGCLTAAERRVIRVYKTHIDMLPRPVFNDVESTLAENASDAEME